MLSAPSFDDLLEGVIASLQNDIMPALTNPKDMATVGMMQAVIQQIRQALPMYDVYLAEEINDMSATLRAVAAAIAGATGPDADRIRERARTMGAKPDVAIPPPRPEVMAAHKALGDALVATLTDVDALQRAGEECGDRALQIVRGHWGPRYKRDVETLLVGAGMIGRG